MRFQNPFRTEAAAFRFVLLLIGYFAVIVIADQLLGRWGGYTAFALLTLAVLVWIAWGGRREPPVQTAPVHRGGPDERRVLVIANETVGGEALRDMIREKTEGYRSSEVLVVCPALNTPLRHWASDEDPARREAHARLDRSLARLGSMGISARGEVGDSEPLQAIEDALRTFGPDEVILSTHPEGRSNWLERGVVRAARERFAVPITHVIVDLEAEREEVR